MSWILEYCVIYLLCVYIIYVRLVMSSYLFCCIYFDAWCITCYPKREETLEVYKELYVAYICYCLMLGVSHVEVCISARFAGGVRFHRVVFLIQYILHKDET